MIHYMKLQSDQVTRIIQLLEFPAVIGQPEERRDANELQCILQDQYNVQVNSAAQAKGAAQMSYDNQKLLS